jgi:WhiB family redox-sensing transcriptional regulator
LYIGCERREENVQAVVDRCWSGGLWTARLLINRQVTRLSPSFTQANRQRITGMRSSSEPGVIDLALTDQDLTPAWQQDAECVNHAGRVDFFPARGESVRDAKAVCASCPVRSECLEFALRMKVAHGVWGGLSERERRSLRRERG